MNRQFLALRQLDQQGTILKNQGLDRVPKEGWVRTLRKALGMTIKQLARRLQVDPSRVVKIEMSEQEGAVTLRTLEKVAQAYDCHLAYAFIPNRSFEALVKERARALAKQHVQRTAHTMSLEAQTVDQETLEQHIDELVEDIIRQSWKQLWEEE